MIRIKKGYIILFVLFSTIYFYKSYTNKVEKEEISQTVKGFLDDIRHQDIFVLHDKLSPSLKKYIAIEDIKEFVHKYNLSRDLEFNIKEYEKEDELTKVKAIVKDKSLSLPLEISYEESNQTLIKSLKLGKAILKAKKYTFPIVLTTQEKNATK
jgi:hypothetical protein